MKNRNLNFFNIKNGFTLAEVLITLVIIGVIAAMTIPTTINNLQRNELRSQFKKAVSVSAQAIQKMKTDYGDLIFDKDKDSEQAFRDKFIKYFSVICKENCVNEDRYKNFTNSRTIEAGYFAKNFIVQDGTSYGFHKGENSHVMYISVDINGSDKKPNRWGYDVFSFYISDDQMFVPCSNGIPASDIVCNNSSSSYNGIGCAAKATYDANYFKNLP